MHLDDIFWLANSTALVAWGALTLLPRRGLLRWVSFTVIGLFCSAYGALVATFLFPSGGDFSSLDGVRRLFDSRPVLLAGWLHYLAFDLLTGWWLAQRLDARGVARLLQAPVLLTTFMLGPIGLLLGGAVLLPTRPRASSALPASA